MTPNTASALRERLGHPVLDSDGHTIEFTPALYAAIENAAGRRVRERFESTLRDAVLGWYAQTPDERLRRRPLRPAWWATPARNTLDRATAMLPRLLYERMDELGLDFTRALPDATACCWSRPRRRGAAPRRVPRASTRYNAEVYGPYADRLTPVAVIPMHTPEEAIAELRIRGRASSGLKAAMFAGYVGGRSRGRRSPRPATLGRHASASTARTTTTRCGRAASSSACSRPSTPAAGLGRAQLDRRTTCTTTSATSRPRARRPAASLFLGGVTRRFPELRFAFLEGGVAWACAPATPTCSATGRSATPRRASPTTTRAALDRAALRELFEREYAPALPRRALDDCSSATARALHDPDEPARALDEFAALRHRARPRTCASCFARALLLRLRGRRSDERLGLRRAPQPARRAARARSSAPTSATGTCPTCARCSREAWELVEHGLISPDDFRAFVFDNPLELWTAANPDFFDGTRVEKAARAQIS